MELRRYFHLILSWWWLLALATLVAGGLSWYISSALPKVYRASATIHVNQAQDVRGLDYNSVLLSERLAQTYADLVRKPPVLTATIERLGLHTDVRRLAERVDVRVVRNTQLLEIGVEDEDPRLARDIANTIAEVFIAQRIADQTGSTTLSREVLQKQIRDLETEITETSQALEQARRTSSPESAEVARLQNLLSQQQVTYSQLLRSEVDMALAEARASNALRLVVPAELPLEPVRPRVLLNTLLAAAIGLLLAIGIVFLLEYLDDTVKTEQDVQETSQLPVLAAVPVMPGKSTPEPRVLEDMSPKSALGEAYRILRTNLDFSWVDQRGQVVMLSSPDPGVGKTTTVANMGIVLARAGRRVVLVDADLRRPSLHRAFGVDGNGDRGLTTLLVDPQAELEAHILPTDYDGLELLPSGPVPPNPSELLGSQRFAQVLRELRRRADVVLVDTPPLLAAADPAVVGRHVDGAVLVAEAGGTRRQALTRAVEVLARSSIRRLGVVLNKVRGRSSPYAYYYYY